MPISAHARRLGAALLIAACSKSAPPPAAPPPPEVRIITVSAQPIANVIELPGRLQAVRMADVRARVDGIVQRRLYTEGTDVREGQPLFEIDARPMRAQVNAAEAALARAQATAANAEQDVNRYKGLVAQQALSQQEYDAAVARLRTAQADVAERRAQIAAARLNLGYTTVTAPISGRAGRAEVTEGALVKSGEGTLLTRIEQLDPIYANFSQSSSDVLALRGRITSSRSSTLGKVPVHLVLEDGSQYRMPGYLDFFDLSIDEATGTAALRAQFPNPQRALLPGQFVRARVEAGTLPNGFRVPQRAVTLTPQGGTVMVVGAKDIVEARPVKLGSLEGDAWLIQSGLTVGERVIVDGLQKAAPGSPVKPVVSK
ncbi:MAG TPA: efflux RND transporter periplasmic adaptor subunit [Gemmatimonadaceae bacterium]|jgi:membrane fusion protein (multidrug efflux system)|nr:efflux RND transporter periplasmic adaptor subunit [Gemmatimonadaceae bacterium]